MSNRTVTVTTFRLTPPGADIRGDYRSTHPESDEGSTMARHAAIVVCHGFKGFKDWGFFPFLCDQLVLRTGIPVVSFNFDGSGVRETDFDDLDAFSDNTFTRELFDLEAVLDGLARGRLGEVVVTPARRFGLLGHSRGGATCILKAALRSQVEALVTWASIASVQRYKAWEEQWEAGHNVVIPNARTGQDMPLTRKVLDDIRANGPRLDVLAAADALHIPVSVIHGTADQAVLFDDAEALAGAIRNAELVRIEGGSHTFQAVHPFKAPTPELEMAIEASATLFAQALA